jgi:hypothetical protein
MPEDDWYGPFRKDRWRGYLFIASGLVVVILALAGFTFDRYPAARWGTLIQWPPLVGGALAIAYGVYHASRDHP